MALEQKLEKCSIMEIPIHMDAFQRKEANRRLLALKAPSIWVEFRTATESLVKSYNDTTEGKTFPVMSKPDPNGCSLLLERQEGLAQDQFHSVTLGISIRFEKSEYIISAVEEHWLTRFGGRIKHAKSPKHYRFVLEADETENPDVYVRYEDQPMDASLAAETFLLKALSLPEY
jgi:hypothetical protein